MNGDDRVSEQQSADEHVDESAMLDGNSAAGILSEVFVPDLTTARATCANCGANRAMAALAVYAHGMGTVMRCPSCDSVVMRIARTRTRLWLDPGGAKLVVMAAAPAIVANDARL